MREGYKGNVGAILGPKPYCKNSVPRSLAARAEPLHARGRISTHKAGSGFREWPWVRPTYPVDQRRAGFGVQFRAYRVQGLGALRLQGLGIKVFGFWV